MNEKQQGLTHGLFLIKYRHYDCPVNPDIEWQDMWDCPCNGECPACGTKDIEPIEWKKL